MITFDPSMCLVARQVNHLCVVVCTAPKDHEGDGHVGVVIHYGDKNRWIDGAWPVYDQRDAMVVPPRRVLRN